MSVNRELVLILDFGSQYTQLIARRIRELKVYCEIHPYNLPLERDPRAARRARIVLSGGPSSVLRGGRAAGVDRSCSSSALPIARHLLRRAAHGQAARRQRRRPPTSASTAARTSRSTPPARARRCSTASPAGEELAVWMSHGDRVDALPHGFVLIGETPNAPNAAVADEKRAHLRRPVPPRGRAHAARRRAARRTSCSASAGCRRRGRWPASSTRRGRTSAQQVGERGRVICGLSGGVDSSVAAKLLLNAIGERLTCIFVDNGLLRQGERAGVEALFAGAFKADLHVVDAEARFLDGARRRHRSRAEAQDHRPRVHRRLRGGGASASTASSSSAQGTLYPDVIESVSLKGPSATIKSHHNVGGLPERMKLKLVEPLRELFKDEVRELGAELGLPRHVLWRQPFPGPGLAVRVPRRGHQGALRRPARGRRDRRRGDPRRRALRVDLAVVRRAPAGASRSA